MTKIYFRHDKFRKGQDEIIQDIYNSIEKKKDILVHAPTGTGKSDASISAAISYAIENNKKILFLTPKIAQHKIALEVIKGINDKYDTKIRAIDFVGKKNMCSDPSISIYNFYEVCKKLVKKRACPFYENIKPKDKTKKELLPSLINKEFKDKYTISHQEIKEIANNFKTHTKKAMPLCAYELAKVFAKKSNVIIADYYHVFSNKVSNSLLSEINIDLKDCILIIDEAHNLEDRILKLISHSLTINMLEKAITETNEIKDYELKKILQSLKLEIEDLTEKKLKRNKEDFIEKDDILKKYKNDIIDIIDRLENRGMIYLEQKQQDRSALITLALFLDHWFEDKKSYIRYISLNNKIPSIKYKALDVSLITRNIFETVHSSIIMSATLSPLKMYKDILGVDNSVIKEYSSPFESKNKLELLLTDTSTKYNKRTDSEFRKIAKNLEIIIPSIPGNTVVFFPSFEILHRVLAKLKINKPYLVQKENSTTSEFESMIDEFVRYSKSFGAVLFAVMGGKASEGIDLIGNKLIGAVIVGVPLSRMQLDTKAKIDYYQKKFNNGWLYAYIQPAIQKSIQSAGRVIRSNTDRGVIIYLDERYLWPTYKNCIPKDINMKKPKDLRKEIFDFFEKR